MAELGDRARRNATHLGQDELHAIFEAAYEAAKRGERAELEDAVKVVQNQAGLPRDRKTVAPRLAIANELARRAVSSRSLNLNIQELQTLVGKYPLLPDTQRHIADEFKSWLTTKQQDSAVWSSGARDYSKRRQRLGILIRQIWVPDAGSVPPEMCERTGSGFRTLQISGRDFKWHQDSGRIRHCWFNTTEHAWIHDTLRGMKAEMPTHNLVATYSGLQKKVTSYVGRAAIYNWDVVEYGQPPLWEVSNLLRGGTVSKASWWEEARRLVDSAPQLQGAASSFIRDAHLVFDL